MISDEKMLLSEVLGAVDAYDMHKAKKGLTVKMQFIAKDESSCSCHRESFRSYKDAIKYLEKFASEEKDERA